jgi:pimeloyl-ACP methyl ester carboxylesterase
VFDFDVADVLARAGADPAFSRNARHWTARVHLDLEVEHYELRIDAGKATGFARVPAGAACDVRIAAPAVSWQKLLQAIPPPGFDDPYFAGRRTGFRVEGDLLDSVAPYYAAIQDFLSILRRARSGPAPERPVSDVERRFDSAVGRYVYVRVDGVQYRVYFEEAGAGPVPMILQHTAGADGRQWRHVLEDPDYQRRFRMIAYDLPYHARSLPPTSERWWESQYRLTKDFLMKTVVTIARALDLERPVYMGCSIGGHLAPDLALAYPEAFRAVIGINAGLATPGTAILETSFDHPRISGDWKVASMLANTAPTSPEAYRRETAWIYGQGAPQVFKGDIYYYAHDHDLTGEEARRIDTSRVGVYLLTGEYDPLAVESGTAELARNIDGCRFERIPGLGHFGPAENPEDFKSVLLPILDEILATR